MRWHFYAASIVITVGLMGLGQIFPGVLWAFVVVGPLLVLGLADAMQRKHTIRRNFPLLGRFRYMFESIRPEIQQYFVESDLDGKPFSREQRAIVYQRGKLELATLPFGTRMDTYSIGYEWLNHSLAPVHVDPKSLRVTIGGPQCAQPYSASVFNIAAMSFGSLSRNAVLALNGGAKLGNFAQDTGEGGLTPWHLEPGGDIIWEIGTGYFSCRTKDGKFDPEAFKQKAAIPNVKMIEVKLSQGAKPSHGGILPASKVTPEIAAIRGVEPWKDVLSPPAHSEFTTPVGLLKFIQRLRELSNGKPVGFKLCIGKRREFFAICKAMQKTGILPDFIAIDGGEGGTGAAPLEFSNHVGAPLRESIIFVHNALTGFGYRQHIKLICSGKVVTGFDLISRLAIGADICTAARSMMLALGCIQALRCNNNKCPTGVATQNPMLARGLDVTEKRVRVFNYHQETVKSVAELIGAMGLHHTQELRPWQLMKRTGLGEVRHYAQLYDFVQPGALLQRDPPSEFAKALAAADPDTFASMTRR